ncbi:MAG: threonine ammonia-lyase [Herpetosiphon sp.]
MVGIEAIYAAQHGLDGIIVRTPLFPSDRLSRDCGATVSVKAENIQRTGSFKLRGAYNKMMSLSAEERRRGVVTYSAGNHAQGVALAARLLKIPALVVMPTYAPLAKIAATRNDGAEVVLHGASYDDAGVCARELQQQRCLTMVPAFDDPFVIAGQGTIGLEVLSDQPDLDLIVVPVGGGGLISGIATALRALKPTAKIVGVQAEGCASMRPSLDAGKPLLLPTAQTIADGIAVKCPGGITLPLIHQLVDDIVTVSEEEIARGVVYAVQNLRQVAEGAGAVGISALLAGKIRPRPGDHVCVVLSGGNIDANFLARVIEQVLVKQGRYVVVHTTISDRPGALAPLVNHVGQMGANIVDLQHRRAAWQVAVGRVGVELILEVRDEPHARQVIDDLAVAGYGVERIGAGEYPP